MNNRLFYVDIASNLTKTVSDFVGDVASMRTLSELCDSSSYIDIFEHIAASLIFDLPIILLDSDMTVSEKESLVENNTRVWSVDQNRIGNLNEENYIDYILKPKKEWSITLFTSGTTGLPKKISHSFESITRSVRRSDVHCADIWGFAYNPTHMAGIQVFFQALINQNTIVRLFGFSKEQIFESIDKYNITHISATPTFYRLLLPNDKSYQSVKRLTSGGEKFDANTLEKLQVVYPNAKITNVYASTEAGSLLASSADCFIIKPEDKHLFKIENDELIIHKSLLGNSQAISLEGDWYPTSDIVEVVGENPTKFRFASRKNEMINVGGYKVNPTEVEEALRKIAGIRQAVVYCKANRLLGNVICCDVEFIDNVMISEAQIRSQLTEKLQEFKIPRIINFVDKIKTTRTGKISRS